MNKELEVLKRLKETIISSSRSDWETEYYYVSGIESIKKDFDIIEEALKRNEPMKPLKVNNTKLIYWCSKCDCSSIQRYDKFCHECGQNLDWGDKK